MRHESTASPTNKGPSGEDKKADRDKKVTSRVNPPNPQSPISWKSLTVGGSLILAVTLYFQYLKTKRQERVAQERQRSIGAALIECNFDLIDTNGKRRTSEEFLGQWLLVYFGFTHCPDVCPEELEKLSAVVEKVHEKGFKVVPIFITVDPERDKPELISKYLSEFSDKFIGLTGDEKQIQQATRAFRVYYSPGPKDRDEDYIVDHTIISYLIDPNGKLADYYGQTRPEDEIITSIMFNMRVKK